MDEVEETADHRFARRLEVLHQGADGAVSLGVDAAIAAATWRSRPFAIDSGGDRLNECLSPRFKHPHSGQTEFRRRPAAAEAVRLGQPIRHWPALFIEPPRHAPANAALRGEK